MQGLWSEGYSPLDIITTMFRVTRGMNELQEYFKLEFIRVGTCLPH